MIITINEKEYELHFGWDFIEEINKLNGVEVQGMAMNTGGVTMLDAQLEMNDPVAVKKAVKAGLSTAKSKPSIQEIEDYVVDMIERDEYDDFLNNLKKKLSTQPLTKIAMDKDKKNQATEK